MTRTTWIQDDPRNWTGPPGCRVRRVGLLSTPDERPFLAYEGPHYCGSWPTLELAQAAAERSAAELARARARARRES